MQITAAADNIDRCIESVMIWRLNAATGVPRQSLAGSVRSSSIHVHPLHTRPPAPVVAAAAAEATA